VDGGLSGCLMAASCAVDSTRSPPPGLPQMQSICPYRVLREGRKGKKDMQKFLAFLGIGSFFATVEEFLTVVVLKHDLGSYIFTLLILFPVFLTFVYFSSRVIDRFIHTRSMQELTHYLTYGVLGLMIEWFLIGLAPWSDPSANPLVMFVFQLGMFSFWATVGFAPRLFTNTDELSGKTRRTILKFYIPYFVAAYVIAFLVPQNGKFLAIIGMIVLGYVIVNTFFVRYFLKTSS
jgi:hypothetical protein